VPKDYSLAPGERRRQVMERVERNMTPKEIAEELNMTPSAVSQHIRKAAKHGPTGQWLGKTKKKVLELHAQGLTPTQIANQLEITTSGVHYHLVGVGIRTQGNRRTDIDMDHVKRLYEEDGLSVNAIAKIYRYDGELLRRRMDRAGIPRRTNWRQLLPKGKDNCQYKDGKGKDRNKKRDQRSPRRTAWQIAAICLGHPLPRGWVVHHHDENPDNNDWYNLWLFPSWREHGRYHGRLSYLQYAGIEADATQLALENGGLPLPPPPSPISSARDKDRPDLWEKLRSRSRGQKEP
jgi:DNA-binding CsgD family transcriptional regulator